MPARLVQTILLQMLAQHIRLVMQIDDDRVHIIGAQLVKNPPDQTPPRDLNHRLRTLIRIGAQPLAASGGENEKPCWGGR